MGANSYNICPRCGNSNSLSAKYCSRCGGQLKVPEQPVVCHKCHTHNSPMANFCRNCGAELKVGYESKICPKCGKEVDAHENVCTCGYSFVTYQQAKPSKRPIPAGAVPIAPRTDKRVYITKGGRGWAIASMVILFLLAYYILVPYRAGETSLRLTALNNLDGGIATFGSVMYGGNYIALFIEGLGSGLSSFGSANTFIAIIVIITTVSMIVQFVISLIRAITGKRPKHLDWYNLAMFAFSVIAVSLISLFNNISSSSPAIQKVADVFCLPEGYRLGYALWSIPLYYLCFFLLHIISRARYLKERK